MTTLSAPLLAPSTDEAAILTSNARSKHISDGDGPVPYDQLENLTTNSPEHNQIDARNDQNNQIDGKSHLHNIKQNPSRENPISKNPFPPSKPPLSDAILARFLPVSYYIIYFLLSSMQELPMTSIAWLLNKSTKFTPEELTIYYNLCFLPWTIKPLWGFIADNIPICGYRRKPYMIFFSVLAAFVFIVMTFYSTNKGYMRIFGVLQALCVVFSEVQVDGLVVAYSNQLLVKQKKLMKLFPAFGAILEPEEDKKDNNKVIERDENGKEIPPEKTEKVTAAKILEQNPTYSQILTQHEYQLLSTRFPKALIQSEAMTMRTTSSLIAAIISLILHLFMHPKGVIRLCASIPIALIFVIIIFINENGKTDEDTVRNNKRFKEIAFEQKKLQKNVQNSDAPVQIPPSQNDILGDSYSSSSSCSDSDEDDCKDCPGCQGNDVKDYNNVTISAEDDIIDSSYLPESINTTSIDNTNAKFYQSCACPEHKSYYEIKKEAQKDPKNSQNESTISLLPRTKKSKKSTSSDSDLDSTASSPLSFCLSCFILRIKAVFGAVMIVWKPLLFMLILRSVPTPTDPMMSYIFGHLTLPPWLLSGYSFVTIAGGLLASLVYWKFFVNFAIIPAFILFTILAATLGSIPNYSMTSSWVQLHIDMPDWGWVFCSAFIGSIFGRFAMMPTLILAAETAPQHFGLEATMFSIYTAVNNIGNVVSVAGNLYLIKKLHITFEDFSGLPTMIIICSIASVLPLFFSPLIWCTQRDLKKLDVEERKAKLNKKLKKREKLEKLGKLRLESLEKNEYNDGIDQNGHVSTDFSSINNHYQHSLDVDNYYANNLSKTHQNDQVCHQDGDLDGYSPFYYSPNDGMNPISYPQVHHNDDDDGSNVDPSNSSEKMKELLEQQRTLRRYKLTQIAQELAMNSNDE
jgi:MFS family permease